MRGEMGNSSGDCRGSTLINAHLTEEYLTINEVQELTGSQAEPDYNDRAGKVRKEPKKLGCDRIGNTVRLWPRD